MLKDVGDRAGEAEVAELGVEVAVDEDVLRFEVAVQDFGVVQVFQGDQHPEGYFFDVVLGELRIRSEQPNNIIRQILLNQQNLPEPHSIRYHNLIQPHNIGMRQHPQQHNLPQYPQRLTLFLNKFRDAFDSNLRVGFEMHT